MSSKPGLIKHSPYLKNRHTVSNHNPANRLHAAIHVLWLKQNVLSELCVKRSKVNDVSRSAEWYSGLSHQKSVILAA